jgi:hypothetical protein
MPGDGEVATRAFGLRASKAEADLRRQLRSRLCGWMAMSARRRLLFSTVMMLHRYGCCGHATLPLTWLLASP